MNSVGVSRDDDKFEFLTEFWGETHAFWIYSDYLARFEPNLTRFTLVWPLFRLIGPQRILNLNSGQNSESKHMYVGYIATNLPDLTLIWRFWPKFDLLMTWFDLKEFWICILDKIRSRTICILGIFRLICPIWPWFDGFDQHLTSFDLKRSWYIHHQNHTKISVLSRFMSSVSVH